jgi:toxin secretion/phage lysis holin
MFQNRILGASAFLEAHHYKLGVPLAGVATGFTFAFGAQRTDLLGYAFCAFALDVVTGVIKGGLRQSLSSRVAVLGLQRKLAMIASIVFGNLADHVLGSGTLWKVFFCDYVILTECLSIAENLSVSGVMIPDRLRALFADSEVAPPVNPETK